MNQEGFWEAFWILWAPPIVVLVAVVLAFAGAYRLVAGKPRD